MENAELDMKSKELKPVDDILFKIDEYVDSCGSLPFTNKKSVDPDELHELVDKIRLSMPGEMKRAKEVDSQKATIVSDANKEADGIIEAAKQQADAILRQAKAEADKLVSEQEIVTRANDYARNQVQRANDEAAEIIDQAREKEKAIRAAMVENINSSLSQAAAVLQKNLDSVNSTMEAISKIAE